MKKILIGCGVLFLLLAGLIVGGGFWMFNKARHFGAEVKAAQEEFDKVNREFPFTAPPDGKLTEKQLADWLNMREAFRALQREKFEQAKERGPVAVAEAIGAVPESMKMCAARLKEKKMSAREYAWITDQVFGALKSRAAAKHPKLADLGAMLDQPIEERPSSNIRYHQENRMRIAPLGPAEAEPILKLLEPEAGRVRNVAHVDLLDMMFQNGGPRQAPPRTAADEDQPTTR